MFSIIAELADTSVIEGGSVDEDVQEDGLS
jgi:hypothetical protein